MLPSPKASYHRHNWPHLKSEGSVKKGQLSSLVQQ
jgi:hypothetical protein